MTDDERAVDPSRFILDVARFGLNVSRVESEVIRRFVADRGYGPSSMKRADAVVRHAASLGGRTLRGREQLPAAERDYLKHAVGLQEWPSGISPRQYVESLRAAVLDVDGGIFLARVGPHWGLTFAARSGPWRGPHGGDWIIVGYGVDYGHWTTGFQPRDGLARYVDEARRGIGRWLQEPTLTA